MSVSAGTAYIDILPNLAKFQSGIVSSMRKSGSKMALAGAVAGGFMLDKLVGVVSSGISAARTWEVATKGAQRALANAFKDIHIRPTFDMANIKNWAQQIQDMAGIPEEQTVRAAGWLSTFHSIVQRGPGFFHQALVGVANLAAALANATGGTINFTQAQRMLGKALGDPEKGMTALQRVGIMLTDQQKAHIKTLEESGRIGRAQGLLLAWVEAKVKGLAATYGQTLQGKLDRANASWHEAKRELAEGLMPTLATLAGYLAKVATYLAKHPALMKALAIAVGLLSVALIGASIAWAAMTLAASPWLLIAAGIALDLVAIGAAFVYAYRHSETFRMIVQRALKFVTKLIDEVRAHWRIFALTLFLPVVGPILLVIGAFKAVKATVAAVKRAWQATVGAVKSAVHAIDHAIRTVVADIGRLITWIIKQIVRLEKAIEKLVSKLPGGGVLKDIVHYGNPLTGAWNVGKAFAGLFADGGTLGPGQWGIAGEAGPEIVTGGRHGSSVVPAGALGGAHRHALTITNWDEGTGYMETIADGAVGGAAIHGAGMGRMA